MTEFEGCQLPSVPKFATETAEPAHSSLPTRFKRLLAVPWNNYVKRWLKQAYYTSASLRGPTPQRQAIGQFAPAVPFERGDLVRVRSREEILSTLDPFKEVKGCAFLPYMYQYCGTEQRVLKSMRRFLDERDFKVKKVRGLVLLENVICNGTPVFGECDRCCFLFWREEWLEKLEEKAI